MDFFINMGFINEKSTYEQHRHFIPARPLFWPEMATHKNNDRFSPLGW